MIIMNIPNVSMALAQRQTLSDVGVALLSKSLDNMEASGEQLVDMMQSSMELSVNPAVGSNVDLYL